MIRAENISRATNGKPVGNNSFMGHCPAHDDKTPSLSIRDANNGKPLVKCMAGCPQEAVIAALKQKGAWYTTDHQLSDKDLTAMKRDKQKRKDERLAKEAAKHATAAKKAEAILKVSKREPVEHPYAINKGVPFGNRVKRGKWTKKAWSDALIVPIYSSDKKLTSLQAINVDGAKDFLAGGKIKGCFHPLGKISGMDGKIVIGEGLATVAAVCEVENCPGAVAMNAGNLEPVAVAVRQLAPSAKIIIIADDDQKPNTESNPGKQAAITAATAIGCEWVVPDLGKKADAWDVWHEQGQDGIRAMMANTTTPTVATVAVAEDETVKCTIDYNLDEAPKTIQQLRCALASIPVSANQQRHTAAEVIGWGLRHIESKIESTIGRSLCKEWDNLTGGKSYAIFTTCDPEYSATSPVTVASIYDLAKKNGWDGQAPWGEPGQLITHSQTPPYPLYTLPAIIRDAVREVLDYSQVPVSLAACSALSAVSSVVQSFVDVRRDNMLEGPTGLFVLAVAESGERKSTVDGYFTKQITEWEREINEQFEPEMRKYYANNEAWEARKNGVISAIKQKAKTGKDVSEEQDTLEKLNTDAPLKPIVPRILYGDTTPEKISRNLSTGWPVAAIISSEAGVIFGGHGMSKDAAMRNMSALNVFWDGKTTSTDRQTTDSYKGRPARVTMGLAVQPETVRSFLDASKGLARGIGWLSRFLVAHPESTQGYRPYKKSPVSWPALDTFNARMSELLHDSPPIDERGNIEPTVLTLEPDAFAEWESYYNDVEAELRPGREMSDAKDIASKSADNAARLAGLFHFFGSAHPAEPINKETMAAACKLAGWHLYEAQRFFGEIALPAETSNAVKLDQWLLGYCKDKGKLSVQTRIVRQYAPGSIRSKSTLDAAIKELMELYRIRIVKEGRKKLLQINPVLLEVA